MIRFGSPTKEKVLTYFFTNPHKNLHLRQIAGILGVNAGNLSREMGKMEKEDYFIIEKKANLKIYTLNRKHPIFNELKKIISKTSGVEAQIKNALKKIAGIKMAFIFGSFARGKEDQFSDIDLMLIGNPDENELVTKISRAEIALRREINYNIFSAADFRKGLLEKEVFLEEIITNSKIFIIGEQNDLGKIIRKRRSSAEKDQPKRN